MSNTFGWKWEENGLRTLQEHYFWNTKLEPVEYLKNIWPMISVSWELFLFWIQNKSEFLSHPGLFPLHQFHHLHLKPASLIFLLIFCYILTALWNRWLIQKEQNERVSLQARILVAALKYPHSWHFENWALPATPCWTSGDSVLSVQKKEWHAQSPFQLILIQISLIK